jgi:hypothetical protein
MQPNATTTTFNQGSYVFFSTESTVTPFTHCSYILKDTPKLYYRYKIATLQLYLNFILFGIRTNRKPLRTPSTIFITFPT